VVIPTYDKTLPSALFCIDTMLRRFGAAPTYLLTDNERTVTIDRVAGLAVRHPLMVGAGRHYGLSVETCVAYDPETKAWATDCTSCWFGSEGVVHGSGSRVIAAVALAHILPRAVGPRRRLSGRTRRSTSEAVLARRVRMSRLAWNLGDGPERLS
jgi:hypothetical protein